MDKYEPNTEAVDKQAIDGSELNAEDVPCDAPASMATEPVSRMQLVWDVMLFQLKLTVDGLRDVLLVPISLLAALAGLVIGGKYPGRYFRQVLKFGRRTEEWINLFGHRKTIGTADEIMDPLKQRVFEQAEATPWLKRTGHTLNRSLDTVGDSIRNASVQKTDQPNSHVGAKPDNVTGNERDIN